MNREPCADAGGDAGAAGAVPALDVVGVTVAYDASPVVWDASLSLAPSRLMAIVGPNGAGKTTLLPRVPRRKFGPVRASVWAQKAHVRIREPSP